MRRRPSSNRWVGNLAVSTLSVLAAMAASYAFQAWTFLSDDRRSKLDVIVGKRAAGRPAYTAFGNPDKLFQCRRCHYGRAGYRLVAQVLEQSGLLPAIRR
ncbi:MAG: hypothetical protein K2X44_06810 [Magnetospirillum sp.]|nr:hypothetical protein [Magnetospirillum sp.]